MQKSNCHLVEMGLTLFFFFGGGGGRELCKVPFFVCSISSLFFVCLFEMNPMISIFAQGQPYSGIKYVNRRFAEFRRRMKVLDSSLQFVLPKQWWIPYRCAAEFCEISKNNFRFFFCLVVYLKKTRVEINR